jgi:sulfatase maturation enzyme AslB (radical SAM superfamily)
MANDHFCVMPFVHAFVTHKDIGPCCAYTKNPKLNSAITYWSSDQLQKIKEDMLNNVKNNGCNICWKKEERGYSSLRNHSNEIYKDYIEDIKKGIKYDSPFFIDLRLGNLCNLKCRMCNSDWSSQIADEILTNPNELWNRIPDAKITEIDDNTWQLLDTWIPYVKRVFMTGGEPTIIKKNLEYIKKIIDSNYAKNIELIFTTNATNINKEFLNLAKNFKSVHFAVSIDGTGELASYIRYPSNWSKIKENLQLIAQDNFGISINTTIQWLNMSRLDEFFNFLSEFVQSKPKQFAGVWFQLVTDPNYLDPIHAPIFLKEKAIKDIDEFLTTSSLLKDEKYSNILFGEFKNSLISCRNFLEDNLNSVKHVDQFIKQMNILDRLRKQKLTNVLPEFQQLGEYYVK